MHSTFNFGPRRAKFYKVDDILKEKPKGHPAHLIDPLTKIDLTYRTLCSILFNFVPNSGHPGGSVSSGRIVESLLYGLMDYDFSRPDAQENDLLCYAAGHKALGLYAQWALRNECVRIAAPKLLPQEKRQLRLEDLLGFRRNPTNSTPLFKKHNAKALDGHPTPATPYLKLATGASGVGDATAIGLAFGALDTFGEKAPTIHILEGEAGMTPGRVVEAMAGASSAQLKNIVLHVDWNQASIDSNKVCREGATPGDYVQWSPAELAYLHDWNVIEVPNGFDFDQILAAQTYSTQAIKNNQPTAIVYRTIKGWKYGVEGRSSHGAGHAFCSEGFYHSLSEFEREFGKQFPRFSGEKTPNEIESEFFNCLMLIRETLEKNKEIPEALGYQIELSKERLAKHKRAPRAQAPKLSAIFEDKSLTADSIPKELALEPGQSVSLKAVLCDVLNYLNKKSQGAFVGSAADLAGSTNLTNLVKGMTEGYYNFESNPNARLLMIGGICEDGIGGFMSGTSSFGNHIGVCSSYAAFIAALEHVTARLHSIGQEAYSHITGTPMNPFFIICAHAGFRTGEDGPTHADPQPLQLMQENFPKGMMITLTPWDSQEFWPLVIASLKARPAVIVPFVTRPNENVVDRVKAKIPPATAAVKGIYALRKADQKDKRYNGTLVLQGNAVGNTFVTQVLPKLDELGINMNIYAISSTELFDLLPDKEKEQIFPESLAREAMAISEFTAPTLYRWVTSYEGRKRSLHAQIRGKYMGSGQADKVLGEAGLSAQAQLDAIMDYAKFMEKL